MPHKLQIFDFDGTLFRNPLDTPENRKLYEKSTGLPWIIDKDLSRQLSKKHGRFIGIRRGWYGRAETLEPPLVPDPAPVNLFIQKACDAFLASKKDPESVTVLLTGRHAGIRHQVLRICGDGKLLKVRRKISKDGKLFVENLEPDVQTWFMGQDGPAPKGQKPTETLPWKIYMVEQFISIFPEVEQIEFWEDRDEHVIEFEALGDVLQKEITVHHIA